MLQKILAKFKVAPNLSKFCQAKFNIILFRCLPFGISRCYLALIGKLYFLCKWRERRLIRRAIEHVLARQLPAAKLRRTVSQVFRGIIDHYHEKLFLAYSNFRKLPQFLEKRINLTGEENLQEALAAGKGVILVTGHFGAVEFLPGRLALKGYPVSIICRFQTDDLRQSLQKRADSVNLNVIDPEKGNVLMAAIKALKAGHILITECDEFDEWHPGERHRTKFLNTNLNADRSLDILHKRSGAPLVTGLLHRNGQKRYTLNLGAIPNGNGNAALPVGVQCLSVLEEAVLADPTQWYQWKKFGQMILPELEAKYDRQTHGYLAPETAVSLSV